jgi:hypothetical protein
MTNTDHNTERSRNTCRSLKWRGIIILPALEKSSEASRRNALAAGDGPREWRMETRRQTHLVMDAGGCETPSSVADAQGLEGVGLL